MRARLLAGGSALLLALITLAARPAAAEEDAALRLERLERALAAQAAQIRRLEAQLAAAGAPVGPTATPPPSATPPSAAIRDAVGSQTSAAVASDVLGAAEGPRLERAEIGGLRWGGYTTLLFSADSSRNAYFDLYRFVLHVSAPLGDRILMSGEIEYEHGGIDTSYLDGEIKIEYLDVLFQVSDAFNPKVGALLIPFARYNLQHDDPLNDFTRRPLTARYLVPTGWGQPGVGAQGVFALPCRGALTYDFAVTAGYDDGFSTASGVRGARQAWQQDNNASKQVWGRVAALLDLRCFDRFELGLSGTWSRYDDDDDHDLFGFAGDFQIQTGPFQFQGEYIQYDLDRAAGAPPTDPRRMSGLWLEGAWHFFPPGCNRPRPPFVTWTSHFTLAFRYQHLDLNHGVVGGAFYDDLHTYGAALNYRITEDTVFRIDWTWYDAAEEEDRNEFTASFSTAF